MATYITPQVEVFQEFSIVPSAVANPLRAHISGGHAQLIRYAQPSEQEQGDLGYYDNLLDTAYDWPERPAGGVVDDAYVKLWVQNALLMYFQDTIGEGSVITKTTGFNNRVRSASISFATNGDYLRSASLLDRDVKVGDVALVRGIDSSLNSIELWTYVLGLVGDPIASVADAATSDENNVATQSQLGTVALVAGDINCVVPTANVTAYQGLPSGYVVETYDLVVLVGSAEGDFPTATIRVLSGSGTDDQPTVFPEPAGTPTPIGTRGLTVTFAINSTAGCSASAGVEGVSPEDLIVGQRWRVTIHQTFTEPVATTQGTYTGINDTTYIVTVTRGGHFTDAFPPIIQVSTINGIDISGPTPITGAGTFPVGTLGMGVSFSGTYLRSGDIYYIQVSGVGIGPMRTVVLGHNLSTDIPAGSEVDLTLFIRNPLLQISEDRIGSPPLTNWSTAPEQFTVLAGITAFDPTWTNEGVPEPLPLCSSSVAGYGKIFVETRYWLSDLCNAIGTIIDVGDIDTLISGALDPDNPLKWGVSQALANANGVEVKYTSVCDPSQLDDWANVLGQLVGREDVYGLVPLTYDNSVLQLYQAHVKSMSSPEQGLWRVLWVNLQDVPEIPIVSAGSTVVGFTSATTVDGEVCLAVIEDNPLVTGTEYTQLRVTTANGQFLKNGVQPGDIVRILYTSDGFGNASYSTYQVDEVQSEDQLLLLTGPAASVNVATKVEIWRNQSADEEANALALNAGSWGSTRVRATWPNQIESGGTVMAGYFMNCALAGLCSGVLPQQGLTHLAISGYTSALQTTGKFNKSQLDAMALGGCWIVTQDLTGLATNVGEIFTRHALTTGGYSNINTREEMLIRNVDSISFRFQDYFKPYIGVTNVTPVVQARLELDVQNLIQILQAEGANNDLGGQLITATIVSLQPSVIELDTYVLQLQISIPYPFNVFQIYLMI